MSTQPNPTRKQRRDAARTERQAAERAAQERARRNRRLMQLGGIVLIAAIAVVAVVLATGGGGGNDTSSVARKPGESVPNQKAIATQLRGIPQHRITLGNPKAPVTLVEFGDLQCPICKQYADTVQPTVVNDYIRTGKVRMEFRVVGILGNDSVTAGRMAEAAGLQNKLFNYAELFYANQGEENTGYVTDDFLRRIGSGVKGLNVDRAMQQRNSPEVNQALADATRLFQINGATGTPTFLLGKTGGPLHTFNYTRLDPGEFKQALDQELAG